MAGAENSPFNLMSQFYFMKRLLKLSAVFFLVMTLLNPAVVRAQDAPFVFNPLLTDQQQDVVKPFSYYLRQSDQIGFKDSPKGVQITYDGDYNTQFGRFMLSAGTPLKPLNSRLRTLFPGLSAGRQLRRDARRHRISGAVFCDADQLGSTEQPHRFHPRHRAQSRQNRPSRRHRRKIF
jgi:hypothetical protein